MSDWQPIETAPMDGTPILVFSPDSIEPHIFTVIWTDWVDAENGEVIEGNWTDLCDDQEFGATITHWQPLPEPPETA